jgi:4-hydroxybenzoate polyprenyltransferase
MTGNLISSLKLKHSVKNFFIFLPLVFGKKLFVYPYNIKVFLGFIVFSIASSAVYLANDIADKDGIRCFLLSSVGRLLPVN